MYRQVNYHQVRYKGRMREKYIRNAADEVELYHTCPFLVNRFTRRNITSFIYILWE